MKTAPTATPLTTVPARKIGIEAVASPATIRASAARYTVSPDSITSRLGSRDPALAGVVRARVPPALRLARISAAG